MQKQALIPQVWHKRADSVPSSMKDTTLPSHLAAASHHLPQKSSTPTRSGFQSIPHDLPSQPLHMRTVTSHPNSVRNLSMNEDRTDGASNPYPNLSFKHLYSLNEHEENQPIPSIIVTKENDFGIPVPNYIPSQTSKNTFL